jgi:hypothetical protein
MPFHLTFNMKNGELITTTVKTIAPLEQALESERITPFEDGTFIYGKDVNNVVVRVKE